jgi:prevent-host-death family protein
MAMINIHQAKTHLSRLLERAAAGEEIVIAKAGKPVARLISVKDRTPRPLGFLDLRVPDAFYDPLPEEELAAWEQ